MNWNKVLQPRNGSMFALRTLVADTESNYYPEFLMTRTSLVSFPFLFFQSSVAKPCQPTDPNDRILTAPIIVAHLS